jgi:hypothetical protein
MIMKSPAGPSDASVLRLTALEDAERTAVVVGRPVPLLKRVLRQPLTAEEAHVGRQFPVLEYRIDAAALRYFQRLRMTWRGEGLDDCPAWVSPLFFADDGQQAVGTQFARSGRLHTVHRIEALQPVPVGALVRARVHIAERNDKPNRPTIILECTIFLVDGDTERAAVRTYATLLL